jgi:hypothetical protein
LLGEVGLSTTISARLGLSCPYLHHIPPDRLRPRLLDRTINWVHPPRSLQQSSWASAYPDPDLAELLHEIEDEFEIKIPYEDMKRMDGTFDAIVRYVALQRRPTS